VFAQAERRSFRFVDGIDQPRRTLKSDTKAKVKGNENDMEGNLKEKENIKTI
jgi:hypothetical protein